jgi:phosphate-selective porin OprO/OprP
LFYPFCNVKKRAVTALANPLRKLTIVAIVLSSGMRLMAGEATTRTSLPSETIIEGEAVVAHPPIVEEAIDLGEELARLRQRLADLERQVATDRFNGSPDNDWKTHSNAFIAASGSATNKTGEESKSPKPDDGPLIDPTNKKWNTRLGGHIQMDYVTWAASDQAIPGAENYFSYRRLRLLAEGTGYGQFDYRLQLTLEPGSGAAGDIYATPDVKDAYLSMNDIPLLGRLRIGNFFVPFSIEQVTNDTFNLFNERSIPTENIFAASREVGIALYNATEDRRITWTTGAFFDSLNDTNKTRIDSNQGLRLSGRLTWLPYYDKASQGRYLIHTGAGVLHTRDHDKSIRFFARPHVQRGPVLIDSGNLPGSSYTAGNIELASVWGPVAMQAESFISSVDLDHRSSATIHGSYAHLSYFLTGENRNYEPFGQHGAQFGRITPKTNFFLLPGGVGLGGIEAKIRWANLSLTNLQAGEYNDLSAGFNWYWSDRSRWMFDWIHPVTSDQTKFGKTDSDLLALRFDVNW